MKKFIIPTDEKLSLSAIGILAKMINYPNMNHKNIYELNAAFNEPFSKTKASLEELTDSEYITCANGIYAVNEQRIPEMKTIHSANRIMRSFSVSEDEHKKIFG